ASINLMVLDQVVKHSFGPKPRIFYSSSACMYPEHNQLDPDNPNCEESSAYPANPDSEYGWEKLFSERMYLAYARNFNLQVRIARFHNIYGPEGTWQGGKEKAPAAICRKVIEATDTIDVWGDGLQTRSFLYIDECIEGIRRLMQSDFQGPVNIGSDEMVTINDLVSMACSVENKQLKINHISGPIGVRGRNSDNTLIKQKLGWAPNYSLNKGIEKTYRWIKSQME
ncbi:NAD-dependent epimerase/dehydratase family protein, partial [bacterium]|nr:NAD-dependent epimerase/dehydratase family protein [Candidatus Elulimicrobium humile]